MIKSKKGAPKKKAPTKTAKKVAHKATKKAAPKNAEKTVTIAGQTYLPPEGGWKIDKKIPIPPKKRDSSSLWPFDKMETGDSFFVPNVKNIQVAEGSIRGRGDYNKVRLTFRAENGGLRVWMVGKKK